METLHVFIKTKVESGRSFDSPFTISSRSNSLNKPCWVRNVDLINFLSDRAQFMLNKHWETGEQPVSIEIFIVLDLPRLRWILGRPVDPLVSDRKYPLHFDTNCPSLLNTKDSTNNFSTCSKYLSWFLFTYYVPVFQIKLVTNVQLSEVSSSTLSNIFKFLCYLVVDLLRKSQRSRWDLSGSVSVHCPMLSSVYIGTPVLSHLGCSRQCSSTVCSLIFYVTGDLIPAFHISGMREWTVNHCLWPGQPTSKEWSRPTEHEAGS